MFRQRFCLKTSKPSYFMSEIKTSQKIFVHSKKHVRQQILIIIQPQSQTSLKCRQVPCKSPHDYAFILHLIHTILSFSEVIILLSEALGSLPRAATLLKQIMSEI